jgi:hypothetical protein
LSSEVEFHLIAYDEASNVIESVGANLSTTFTDMESKTESLANTTDNATNQVADDYNQIATASDSLTSSTEETSMGIGNTAMSMNSLALGGATLYISLERVTNAHVMLDRANLMVQRSTDAVQKAQDEYNKAVQKYGENSPQATAAAEKLRVAQEALTVAHERADMAQRNVNNTMMYAALTVIPSLMTVVGSATTIIGGLSGAAEALGGVLDFLSANPIVLVVAAIAGIILASKYAYDHCEAFRNAVNWLGGVLATYLRPVIEAISAALTWLWNNVLVPVGKFIVDYFVGVWQGLILVWHALNVAISAVDNALKWLWDNVFVPLGKFLSAVFIANVLTPLKLAWDAISTAVNWLWKNVLSPLANFLTGALKTAFDIIMIPVNAFLAAINAIISAAKTVNDFLGGLGKALGSLCFVHATPAAQAFNTTLMDSMDLTDKLTAGVSGLGGSLKELAGIGAGITPFVGVGGGLGVGGVPTPVAAAPVNVYITAPLVNVQGSADVPTASYAAKLVQGQLSSVVVKATSPNAPAANQQVIVNPGMMPGATPTGMAAQAASAIMRITSSTSYMIAF